MIPKMLLSLAVSQKKTELRIARALRALPALAGSAQPLLGAPPAPAHEPRSPISAQTGALSPCPIGMLVSSPVPRMDLRLTLVAMPPAPFLSPSPASGWILTSACHLSAQDS